MDGLNFSSTLNVFHLLKEDEGICKHSWVVPGLGWLFFFFLWFEVDVNHIVRCVFTAVDKMMSKQRLPQKTTHRLSRPQIVERAQSDKSKQWDGRVEENYLPEPLAWRQHQDIHLFCTEPESQAGE